MKKWMYVVVLIGLFSFPHYTKALNFSDVPSTHWAHEPVTFAIEKKLVSGYPDGTFQPNTTLREGHFVKMFATLLYAEDVSLMLAEATGSNEYDPYYRVLAAKGYALSTSKNAYQTIRRGDIAEMLAYAIKGDAYTSEIAYLLLKELGITTADRYDTFQANGSLTRAQGAAFLQRLSTNFLAIASPLVSQTQKAIETMHLTSAIRLEYTDDERIYVYESDALQAVIYGKNGTTIGHNTVGETMNEALLTCPYGMMTGGYEKNNITCKVNATVDYIYYIDRLDKNRVLFIIERAKNGAAPLFAFDQYAGVLRLEAVRQLNVILINQTRAKHKLQPMYAHPLLTEVAQSHADDMAANDYYDHQNIVGQSPSDRAAYFGYHHAAISENIFKGPRNLFEAHAGWLSSEGHRINILSPYNTVVGSGFAPQVNEAGLTVQLYYVDDFSQK